MSRKAFQEILDTLADHFGKLDNQVERWSGHQGALVALFPGIEHALSSSFAPESAPLKIFAQGKGTYLDLLGELSGAQDAEVPTAFLNLRFFILLNAFLQACQESMDKAALNPSLDPAALVERSYYTPYFFDRVTLSSEEMIRMIGEDIKRLEAATPDRDGILLAMRIRKGVVTTLAESYCPTHPMLYPSVQDLDAVKASSDPAVIDTVKDKLEAILSAL